MYHEKAEDQGWWVKALGGGEVNSDFWKAEGLLEGGGILEGGGTL